MAAVEVTISGVLYDKYARTTRPVVLIGEASLTGLEVGGGPIIPGGSPPGFWGPNDPRPTPPIHLGPGGDIGGPPSIGGGPIIPVPPDRPNTPPPGSPPVIVEGTRPVQPIVPPDAVVIEYPGIGKVVVPKPTETGEVAPR